MVEVEVDMVFVCIGGSRMIRFGSCRDPLEPILVRIAIDRNPLVCRCWSSVFVATIQ